MREEWRSVPSLDDLYEVSSLGRVRSKSRVVTFKYKNRDTVGTRTFYSKILSLTVRSGGYLGCLVSIHRKPKYVFVHRLVAEAFLPGFDSNLAVRHIDGDRSNNKPSN